MSPVYDIDGFNKRSSKQGRLKELICVSIFHVSTVHGIEIIVHGSWCALHGCIRGILGSEISE